MDGINALIWKHARMSGCLNVGEYRLLQYFVHKRGTGEDGARVQLDRDDAMSLPG